MKKTNFEFKAKTSDLARLESVLKQFHPDFIGEDRQVDTYFNVPVGRLKLREGNIENALIHYERQNTAGGKQSDILLYKHDPDRGLKDILVKSLGIKAVVNKKRRIYFIGNVKFHFDTVENLGTFVEVEAISDSGEMLQELLKEQCRKYGELFEIKPDDYLSRSYSDYILELQD